MSSFSSFSGRPDTSVPASSSLSLTSAPSDANANDPSSETQDAGAPFVPNIFDLVYLAQRAELSVARPVMQLFLGAQAIDQSTYLGQGASFEVSSKRVPKSEGMVYETKTLGLTLSTRQGQYDERVLVYKTAKIAFNELGEPLAKDRRAMDSVLMEMYALIHPPLYKHRNIVTLLALGWGSNPYNPSYRLPVIVTEYADHGNLAALQAKETLGSDTKLNLSLDIGRGLQILHRCGIIHGDVKSENILVFSDPQKKYVAKLGDFGFSVVGQASADPVRIGGTNPWRAPETTAAVPRHLLAQTDVYSFGLTIWRIAMDGMNPFHILRGDSHTEISLTAEIERLKHQDLLKEKADLDAWYPAWVLSSMDKLAGGSLPDMTKVVQLVQQVQTLLTGGSMDIVQAINFIKYIFWILHQHGMASTPIYGQIRQAVLTAALSDPFYGKVAAALKQCVLRNPPNRNLEGAMSALTPSTDAEQDAGQVDGDILLRRSFDHHLMSWQAVRELQPSVQTFLFQRSRARADSNASRNRINPPECFVLGSFYLNGYGTQPDFAEARRLILHAARNGHEVSQAYAWRIAKISGAELATDEQLLKMMETRAFSGSRAALQDLSLIAPEKVERVKKLLKLGLAGVGASFWDDDLIHGFTFPQWMNTFNNTAMLVKNFSNLRAIADYRVNKRGDRILHMAASCGQPQAIEALLDNFPALTVNQLNDTGETPLLSACRSGHREVVSLLIERGADPTIVTSSKESPLHWLISFEEDEVGEVGEALVSKGANRRLLTTQGLNYSNFPSGVDSDNLPPGTPLTWAVHHDRPDIIKFLIRAAGTAGICVDKAANQPSPMEWAAHYHHRECLEAMISAMKEEKLGFTYLHFLQSAVHSADVFSMVLRNGIAYVDRFKDTMTYLLEETHPASFATGIGSFGHTLLYYAVSEAHDLAAEYLLAPETEQLLQTGWERVKETAKDDADIPIRRYGVFSREHVNIPCGDEQRTPLLECVRWNRRSLFELLISNGAEVTARSRNPFDNTQTNWSALHTFAHAGHDTDISLAARIIEAGVPADAPVEGSDNVDLETPLLVAVKNNAFKLAEVLLRHGANPNAKCVSSGLIALEYPTTILGHIAASTARESASRLRFILTQCPAIVDEGAETSRQIDMIVEPERAMTALHRAAWAFQGVSDRLPGGTSAPEAVKRGQYDFSQNREIMVELLQHFGGNKDYLNARTGDALLRRTALHLAVDSVNVRAVELLLEHETVDASIKDANGQTALDVAREAGRHFGVKCDGPCEQLPIPGRRWHCIVCPDHDLCDVCYRALEGKSTEHEFREVSLSETCADISAKSKRQWVISEEITGLAEIIDFLQARQTLQGMREAFHGLDVSD
ncbi:serine/threonine protein kinase [Capronia epimyces CBS 606.96]|uniref:Serine/threonine protein kinase n=1 Tax=Capronia epimyces CBS 606.96 TaxID=1182542 RepID=W9XUZ5_9EURO|nr:serine/threonine protein kinase [Capronia epimyces CBS 606.96]EXJ81180.1 serine/threonine protein kinase [Capronia epimyces CBS 606.96]